MIEQLQRLFFAVAGSAQAGRRANPAEIAAAEHTPIDVAEARPFSLGRRNPPPLEGGGGGWVPPRHSAAHARIASAAPMGLFRTSLFQIRKTVQPWLRSHSSRVPSLSDSACCPPSIS